MEPKNFGLLAVLCLLLDCPSILGDVIVSNTDGTVVQVGKNAKITGVILEIEDCETGKTYKFDSKEYHSVPGDDCPPKPIPRPPGTSPPP
jgi:hypothetical protein